MEIPWFGYLIKEVQVEKLRNDGSHFFCEDYYLTLGKTVFHTKQEAKDRILNLIAQIKELVYLNELEINSVE